MASQSSALRQSPDFEVFVRLVLSRPTGASITRSHEWFTSVLEQYHKLITSGAIKKGSDFEAMLDKIYDEVLLSAISPNEIKCSPRVSDQKPKTKPAVDDHEPVYVPLPKEPKLSPQASVQNSREEPALEDHEPVYVPRSGERNKQRTTGNPTTSKTSRTTPKPTLLELVSKEVQDDAYDEEVDVAMMDGDSNSDRMDDSDSDGDDVNEDDFSGREHWYAEKRRRALTKHLAYEAKGKELLQWLKKQVEQGEEVLLGEAMDDWVLYSVEYLMHQRRNSRHSREVDLHRGKLPLSKQSPGNPSSRRFVGTFWIPSLPERQDGWDLGGSLPALASFRPSRVSTAKVVEGSRSSDRTEMQIRFLGNGYMLVHVPGAMVGALRKFITFFGVACGKDQHTREMEWAEDDGKWHYCGVYEEGGSQPDEFFCAAEHMGEICPIEDCPKHDMNLRAQYGEIHGRWTCGRSLLKA